MPEFDIRKLYSNEFEKILFLREITPSDEMIECIKSAMDEGSQDIFVIEKDGQIIGEITIVYDGFREEYTLKGIRAYMKGLKVYEPFQGKGYGQNFVSKIITLVKSKGYSEIAIGIEDDNYRAKHVYTKLGFTEFIKREKPNPFAKNGFGLYLKRL